MAGALSPVRHSRRSLTTPRVRRMFFIPDGVRLDDFSHVVLTSAGRYLSSRRWRGHADPLQRASRHRDLPAGRRRLDRRTGMRASWRCWISRMRTALALDEQPDRGAAFLQVTLHGARRRRHGAVRSSAVAASLRFAAGRRSRVPVGGAEGRPRSRSAFATVCRPM